jgi:diguanylate cyclase (GGDEF)-like protein
MPHDTNSVTASFPRPDFGATTIIAGRFPRIFRSPDPLLLEASAGGERLVAWTRLYFWAFISLAPLSTMFVRGFDVPRELLLSAIGALVLTAWSGVVLAVLLRRTEVPPRAGFITGAIDITLPTLTFAAIALAGRGEVFVHSQSGWAVYLLVIMTSCLRLDMRVCLFMGLLAVTEYVALIVWIVTAFDVALIDYDMMIQSSRVMLMAAATALCIGIVHRMQGLISASGFDPLTRLANRPYFNERLQAEISRAERTGSPLSLAVIDLDEFKIFNDTHGHHAGDKALRHVAALIILEKRDADFAARWGGEELILIMPDTGSEEAVKAANRIIDRIRNSPVHVNGGDHQITASVGVSQMGKDGDDGTQLFAAADRRVYRAKSLGRDRVVSW